MEEDETGGVSCWTSCTLLTLDCSNRNY